MNNKHSKYQAAVGARQAAEDAEREAAFDAMPIGATVWYQHGDHMRRATIRGHSGPHGSPRVKVRGSSMREYWIGCERVLKAATRRKT